MPTSSHADSLTEIKLYIKNSQAIYDSLRRFDEAKTNLSLKNKQANALQTQLTACQTQTIKIRNDANQMAVRLFDANEAYHGSQRRLRRANLERWAWRVSAVLTVYLIITH